MHDKVSGRTLRFSTGGLKKIFELNKGSLDLVGVTTTPSLIHAVASGDQILTIMADSGENKTANSRYFVVADSPIKSVQDLKGKTIRVNTFSAHLGHICQQL